MPGAYYSDPSNRSFYADAFQPHTTNMAQPSAHLDWISGPEPPLNAPQHACYTLSYPHRSPVHSQYPATHDVPRQQPPIWDSRLSNTTQVFEPQASMHASMYSSMTQGTSALILCQYVVHLVELRPRQIQHPIGRHHTSVAASTGAKYVSHRLTCTNSYHINGICCYEHIVSRQCNACLHAPQSCAEFPTILSLIAFGLFLVVVGSLHLCILSHVSMRFDYSTQTYQPILYIATYDTCFKTIH
jgi:hypothetical protein